MQKIVYVTHNLKFIGWTLWKCWIYNIIYFETSLLIHSIVYALKQECEIVGKEVSYLIKFS